MKNKYYLLIFLPLIVCIQENPEINYDAQIEFKEDHVIINGDGIDYKGTNVNITSSGSFMITGICNEGTVNIYSNSVNLYLQDLELSSSISSPIFINKNLKNIKIISLNNVNISDYEKIDTTGGDCAAIKIRKNTTVSFYNHNDFYMKGTCKNVIKGASQVDLIFESSPGEYIIDAFHNGVASEGLIIFKGGKFNITTEVGDGIQVKPDKNDTNSLGQIIIEDGNFYIRSHGDAFQSRNRIEIKNGNFNIKTEEGFNSSIFDRETGNSKGFEVTNDKIGSEIIIYDGKFLLDTPDDSFNSEGNLTLINGEYTIFSGDDGIRALDHIFIGENYSSIGPNINIKYSKEGIEGNNLVIYSGTINIQSKDDGINSSKKNKNSKIQTNLKQKYENTENLNSKTILSVYGGEIKIIYDSNGIDSNGDIELLGGEISLISGENGINPIDISSTFKLSKTSLISIGKKGKKSLNELIKSNQKYAVYSDDISKNKILRIENEKKALIKDISINGVINNIFYTSYELNENYTFYFYDSDGTNETKINFEFGNLKEEDDNNNKKDEDEKKGNFVKVFLISFFGAIALLIIIFFVVRAIKRNC